jgi:magnesium-transporting ATPase (P-type)
MSCQIKSIIFDKTGTLTVGKPSVVQTKVFSKMPLLELCDLAAGAEVGFLATCHVPTLVLANNEHLDTLPLILN